MRSFKALLILLISLQGVLFHAHVGLTATYYVSPDGNDSNSGTGPAPWKTLSKAAQTLVAGDTVFIKNGTYVEQVIPTQSGSAGREITYTAFPGHTPVLDGNTLSVINDDWGGLFWIRGLSYINVSGLTIRGTSSISGNPGIAGILVTNSNNITLESNIISYTRSSGIGVWDSSYVRVIANDIQKAVKGGSQECLTVANSSDFEVARNHVHNGSDSKMGGEGIGIKESSAFGSVHHNHVYHLPDAVGIYVDAYNSKVPGAHDIEVYNNRVYDVATGIALGAEQGGDLQGIRVFNNIVHHTDTYGVIVTDWMPQTEGTKQNISIFNNTIVANGKTYGGGLLIAGSRIEDIFVFNNLLADNLLWQLAANTTSQSQIFATNNLLNGENNYKDGNILAITGDSAVINKDPMFISDTDYHLRGNSPAIDMGIMAGAPGFDFDQVVRPQGSAYDIGAYEYLDPGSSEIMLLGPNGAEVLSPGSIYDILWSSSSQAVQFDILYSTDNGVSWIPIARGVKDRSYAWRVPNLVRSKSKCFVRVIGYDQRGLKIGADKSDAPFSIEVVKLTAPSDPGTSMKSGETYDVTWTTSMTGPAVQKVVLYYTKNAAAVPIRWNRIAAFKPDDYPGVYPWTVPTLPGAKTKCKVKVVLKDAGGKRVGVDVSDEVFAIQGQPAP